MPYMRLFIPLLNVVELAIAIVKQKRKVLISVNQYSQRHD